MPPHRGATKVVVDVPLHVEVAKMVILEFQFLKSSNPHFHHSLIAWTTNSIINHASKDYSTITV